MNEFIDCEDCAGFGVMTVKRRYMTTEYRCQTCDGEGQVPAQDSSMPEHFHENGPPVDPEEVREEYAEIRREEFEAMAEEYIEPISRIKARILRWFSR